MTSGEDGARVCAGGARLIGAVANAIGKVGIVAETRNVVIGASEGRCQGEHVHDASFTACWEAVEGAEILGNREASEEGGGDDEELHFERVGTVLEIFLREVECKGL